MKGCCKLCKTTTELKLSHFIPKFIGRWSKKTSITGYLREHNEVNKRAQDIAKEYWLCDACETMFSKWETKFANNIFYPFIKDSKHITTYHEWLSRFCASLSWRTLTYIRSKNIKEIKSREYQNELDRAEIHLEKFLLGKEDNLNEYEQHLYPLDRIESTSHKNLPKNINRYYLRTMAMDIIGNSNSIYIYTKLPSFILLGIIKYENLKVIRSSRISLKTGKFNPKIYTFPDGIGDYILESAKEVEKAYNKIPEKDLEKFEEFIRNNPEKVKSSKLFEAFMHDYNFFGNKIIR